MSYSGDEKTAEVQTLVRSQLELTQTSLGSLDRSTEYDSLIEAVHAVLLYDPDAVFYLILQARHALLRILRAELALCDDLLGAVDDLSMPNRPVEDISGLSGANNALLTIDSAIARRGSASSAELRRYQRSMTKFTGELARTVKMTYVPRGSSTAVTDIVRPSARAALEARLSFRDLQLEHTNLLTQLARLRVAFSEFSAAKLPAKVGAKQLARARVQLSSLQEKLEGLTPSERVLEARSALLTALANGSAVAAVADPQRPGVDKLIQAPSSSPEYRVRAYGQGTAPAVTATTSAPFPLQDSSGPSPTSVLGFSDLNGVVHTVDLFPVTSPSYREGIRAASVLGAKVGDFAIGGTLLTPYPLISTVETWNTWANGNRFHIVVDGVRYECVLSAGLALTAAQAKLDLDNPVNWVGSRPEITVAVTATNQIQISYSVVSPPIPYVRRRMEILQGTDYAQDLWPWTSGPSGATVASSSSGWDRNSYISIQANDSPIAVLVSLPLGSWPDYQVTAAAVAAAIDAAGGAEFTASVVDDRVQISSERRGEGSIITIRSGGLYSAGAWAGYGGMTFRGMQTLGFSDDQEDRATDVDGHVVVNRLNRDATFAANAQAKLLRTDYFLSNRAIRSAAAQLELPVESDPTADWPDYGELKVAITAGDNRGVYGLTAAPAVVGGQLQLDLDRQLRDTTADLHHTLVIYREVLSITSTDAGLTGALQLNDPVGSARTVLGFDSELREATVDQLIVERNDPIYGWRASDLSRKRVRLGDTVVDVSGTVQATISSISQLSVGILGVSVGLSPSFSISTAGFRLRSGAYLTYLQFIEALEGWVSSTLPPFEEDLRSIDRALGPILNVTPTRDRVDTAYSRVSLLKTKLEALQTLSRSYSIAAIPAVDAALLGLLEHGFDRARQLLLTGRFSDFFALEASTASLARMFQRAVNDLATKDLNRSSKARARFGAEYVRLVDTWEDDVHPNYDFSDFEEEPPEDAAIEDYSGVDEFEGV